MGLSLAGGRKYIEKIPIKKRGGEFIKHENLTLALILTFPIVKTAKNGMRLEKGGRAPPAPTSTPYKC